MKQSLFFILLLVNSFSYSQGENTIWWFRGGALDFNNDPPFTNDVGAISLYGDGEGIASVCDENGTLLFVASNSSFLNRKKEKMPASEFGGACYDDVGYSIAGPLVGGPSASQILIIPKPKNRYLYYVISTKPNYSAPTNMPLEYVLVDMRADSGYGDIVQCRTALHPLMCEQMAMMRHANGEDIWLITHEFGSNNFYSWMITCNGIDQNPIISSVGDTINNFLGQQIGYMKISPNKKKLAMAQAEESSVMIADFNDSTGIISNSNSFSSIGPYGIEFSPNSDLLYVSSAKFLIQYDLLATNIQQSAQIIGTEEIRFGTPQLGPDSSIYVPTYNNYLGEVENPDILGIGCNYIDSAVLVSGIGDGLPVKNIKRNIEYTDTITLCKTVENLNNENIDRTFTGYYLQDTTSECPSYKVVDFIPDSDKKSSIISACDYFILPQTTGKYENSEAAFYSYDHSQKFIEGDTIFESQNLLGMELIDSTFWCSNYDSLIIKIEQCEDPIIPNIITPNGDDINDKFRITGLGNNTNLTIYNRWGMKVYEVLDYKNDWEGENLIDGVYYYKINTQRRGNMIETFKGWVQILR